MCKNWLISVSILTLISESAYCSGISKEINPNNFSGNLSSTEKDTNTQNETQDEDIAPQQIKRREQKRVRLQQMFAREKLFEDNARSELMASKSLYKQDPNNIDNCININDCKNMTFLEDTDDYGGLASNSKYTCIEKSEDTPSNATTSSELDKTSDVSSGSPIPSFATANSKDIGELLMNSKTS